MFEVSKFKDLLKKYPMIFSDIIGNMKFDKVEKETIFLKDENNKTMMVVMNKDCIAFRYEDDVVTKSINLHLKNKNSGDIKVVEHIEEKRPKGQIVYDNVKQYDFAKFSPFEGYLTDFISECYVYSTDSNLPYFLPHLAMQTTFEGHININGVKITVNDKDITDLYKLVTGSKDILLRIYDLYNGIITKRNIDDVYRIHLYATPTKAFGYKEVSGITEKENEICGSSSLSKNHDNEALKELIRNKIGYPEDKTFISNDLNSLMNAIMYPGKKLDLYNYMTENEFGISCEEFEELSTEEKQKLFDRRKKTTFQTDNHPKVAKSDNDGHMSIENVKKGDLALIGSGVHAVSIRTGITPEEYRKRLNKKLNKIFKK